MPWLVCDPSLSDAACQALARLGMAASPAPVELDSGLNECAVVICHGGHGLVSWALSRGSSLVLLPQHGEQFMLARVLSGQAAARVVALPIASPAARLLDAVDTMLSVPPAAAPATHLQLSDAGQVAEEILRLAEFQVSA